MRALVVLVGCLVLVALVATGIYFGSPYYAVWRLEAAAEAGRVEEVAARSDLPAVRANIDPEVAAALSGAEAAAAAPPKSLFGRLKRFFIHPPRPAARVGVLGPERLAEIIRSGLPAGVEARSAPAATARPGHPFVVTQGYQGGDPDAFSAVLANRDDPERRASLTLERRGFLTWKLTALRASTADHSAHRSAPRRASP